MKKIVGIIFVFMLLTTIVACKDDHEDDIEEPMEEVIEETDFDLVKSQTSDYVIVYPKDAEDMVKVTAVAELQLFFEDATGIELEAIDDEGLTFNENQTYLSIGKTSLLASTDIDTSEDLGESGLKVVTKGQSVFMFGDTRFGSLYSVYEFLEHQFNFEIYAVDEIYLDKDVTDLKLLDFNITDIPTFQYRLGNYGELWNGTTFTRRMRMQTNNDIWISVNGLTYHNFFATVPPEIYKEDHPEWYSEDGKQLDLSTDREGLLEVAIEQLKISIEANPNASNITFTQEDYNLWSESEASQALKAKYGTNAAEMIIFINRIAEEIEEWLEVEHPDRDITFVMFAYHKTEEAPAVFDEASQSYVPIDDDVILRDNVAVLYAPIFASHYYDYNNEANINVAETMEKWDALTDNIYLWSYGTYFLNYLAPYDTFNAIQGKYQYAADHSVQYIFDQGQYNQTIGTDWFRLKEYLSSKLQWDAYLDMDILIDDFFTNYYKDAAPVMAEYFESYRAWYALTVAEMGVEGYVTETNMISRELYPRGVLLEWLDYIDQAYASIEYLKATNIDLYNTLEERITLDSISARYLLLNLYEVYYSAEDYSQMLSDLKYDAMRVGLIQFNEFNTVSDYLSKDE